MRKSAFSCIGINEKARKCMRNFTFSCISINGKALEAQMRMRESTFSCTEINRKAFKGMKFYKCFITAFPLGKFHMRKDFHLKLVWNRMNTAPIWEPKTSYTYFQQTNFIRWIPRLRITLISSFMRNLRKNEDSYCDCDLPRILTPAAGKIQEIGGSGKEMQKCWRSLIHDPYSLSLKGGR